MSELYPCTGDGCCSDCFVPGKCERRECREQIEDMDRFVNREAGTTYCSYGCLLLDVGDVILEDVPLCLVADHAVHVYARYDCNCPRTQMCMVCGEEYDLTEDELPNLSGFGTCLVCPVLRWGDCQ